MLSYTCVLILSVAVSAFSQDGWEIQKNKNGVQMYTRSIDGEEVKEFRGITRIQAPLSAFVAVFHDVAAFAEWMPSTLSARILESHGDAEHIHYIEISAPWPVRNRDAIYRFTYSQDPRTRTVTLEMVCLPDFEPRKTGKVRIPRARGMYRFQPMDNGEVEVVFQMHTEPGGGIPPWLVNWRIVDAPYQTLIRLKDQVRLEKYQNQTFSFLQN